MNKQFQFQGLTFEIYSNGKTYENGLKYFEIKQVGSYQKAAKGVWDHNSSSWAKQPGNPRFNDAIAEAAGLK